MSDFRPLKRSDVRPLQFICHQSYLSLRERKELCWMIVVGHRISAHW